MKEKITKLWLSIWLYIMTLIAGVVLGCLICNRSVWSFQTKLFAFATMLLPLHVLEEWHFPGGFHTMYNLMQKSDKLDRYPMNRLSDMWTNFIGVIFGCIVLTVGVNPIFMFMQLFLCLAEVFGHTLGGIFSYNLFKSKGKKTIYTPGSFTTWFGYIPIAIGIVISFFTEQSISLRQIPIALICSMLLGGFALSGMEKICKNENTPYGYDWGNGYFEKYLK